MGCVSSAEKDDVDPGEKKKKKKKKNATTRAESSPSRGAVPVTATAVPQKVNFGGGEVGTGDLRKSLVPTFSEMGTVGAAAPLTAMEVEKAEEAAREAARERRARASARASTFVETMPLRVRDFDLVCASATRLVDEELDEPPVLLADIQVAPPPLDDNAAAALLKIQNLVRKKTAALEKRRQAVHHVNAAIEYAEERHHNKLDLLMSNLHDKLPELEKKQTVTDSLLETIDNLRATGWPGTVPIKAGYAGCHLPSPVTKDAMIDLLDRLNTKAAAECKRESLAPDGLKDLLHVKYALQIAVEYMEAIRLLKPVVHVSTSLTGKLTVVGDVHGQLRDLFEIFRHNGFPSFDNPYLFNGDLVDRGDYSTEVALLLMGFAVADPGSVSINRGNHEDMGVCQTYGFLEELVVKFPQSSLEGKQLLRVFDTIFSLLPIAHVVDNNVLVIHGGVSDKFTLKSLNEINRRPYRTLTAMPESVTSSESPDGGFDDAGHTHRDWSVLMDCLWSDPAPATEAFQAGELTKPNDNRGGGVLFSAALSHRWLDDHGLGVLVRSHECVARGFRTNHAGRVLTLFSASNYYGWGEHNDGAVLILEPRAEPQGRLLTYSTRYDGLCDSFRAMDLGTKVAQFEAAALQRVNIALLDHRLALVETLEICDANGDGTMSSMEWAAAMDRVVPMKLPWLHLKLNFVAAVPGHPDMVRYTTLTDKLAGAFAADGSIHADKAESLYKLRGELHRLFRILDLDDSGSLDRDEFLKGCELINSLSPTKLFDKSDVDDFMRLLDVDLSGTVSFQEFSEGLLAPTTRTGSQEDEVEGGDEE